MKNGEDYNFERIIFEINGEKHIKYLYMGETTVKVSNLEIGNYDCFITMVINNNINEFESKLKISKKSSNIIINVAKDYYFGEAPIINYNLTSDALGSISIYVDNMLIKNINVGDVIQLPILNGGQHTIKVIYTGDNQYSECEDSILLKINKINTTLSVSNVNQLAGSTLIHLSLGNNVTGNVTININNRNYTKKVENNEAIVDINDLIYGNYTYTAYYSGNQNYNSISIDNTISIKLKESEINISSSDIFVDKTAIINYNILDGMSGTLDVYLNNIFIKRVNIGDNIELTNLKAGLNIIKVIYNNNGFYKSCEDSCSLNVNKYSSEIDIDDVEAGKTTLLKINLNNDATGYIDLEIDGVYYSGNLTDGYLTLKISNLTGGLHNAIINYSGNYKYNKTSLNKSFNVKFKKSFVQLFLDEIAFGQPIIINPIVNSDATSMIKVYVNNTLKEELNVSDSYVLNDLDCGNYLIKVVYGGDDYYLGSENSTTLKISAIDTAISTIPLKQIAGNTIFNITLNPKSTGKITVNINNNNYEESLSNGQALILISDLVSGDYNYKVFYSGDRNFYSASSNGYVEIRNKEANINISSSQYDYDIDETIDIEYSLTGGATGLLSIYVNNTFIKNIAVGRPVELTNLKAGINVIKIVYNSDGYYSGCEDTISININKLGPNVYFDYDYAGYNVPVVVELSEDATGYVDIVFDDEVYSNCKLTDGKTTIVVPYFKAGYHEYTLNYTGDEKYNSINENDWIYVWHNDSPISWNIPEITWGDLVIINPSLPKESTGDLEIIIDDISIANISVGKTYRYNALNGGKHYLTVKYSGDDYFSENETTFEFNVKRFDSTLSVNDTVWANPSLTLFFQLNEEASGLIKLSVNNKQYSGEVVNGTCKISVNNLNIGSNNLIINYTGDSKYNPIYIVKELNVLQKDAKLKLNTNNIISGNNLVIKPMVVSGASGTCKIYVDNTLKTTINVGSSYTLSKPSIGKHEIKIIYSGNSYFESDELTTTFRVFTVYPIVANDMQIIYGSDNYFQAKFYDEYGNALANKYVQFNVNGTDYPVKTNDEGIATLNIKFDVGTYNVTSISILDEAKSNTLFVFHSVQAENMVMEHNSNYRFSATFLDEDAKPLSKTGMIFILDGVTQPMSYTDVNGVAVLDKTLSLGTHAITSINTITNENVTNNVIVVPDINSIINVQDINDVDYGQNPVLTINVGSGYLNANVAVKITGDNGYFQEFSQKAATKITKQLTGLNAGKYTVVVKYLDIDNLLNLNLNKTFNVLKVNPAMNVDMKDAYSGGYATITVNVANSNGTVTIKVGSRTFNEKLTNGKLVKTVNGLSVGDYNVEVLFEGDINHNPMIKTGNFRMYHNWNFNVDFPSEIVLEDKETYETDEWGYTNSQVKIYNLINDENDVVSLFIDGSVVSLADSYPADGEDENGYYLIKFSPAFLSEGSHNWEIRYTNFPNYIMSSESGSFNAYTQENYYDLFNFGLITDKSNNVIKTSDINKNIKTGTYEDGTYSISTFVYKGIKYNIIDGLGYAMLNCPIFVEFNPNDCALYDGVYYKMENGVITDVIDNYRVFDGIYYNFVGSGQYSSSFGEDSDPYYYMIVFNGKCYKVLGFYQDAIKDIDYKVIDGKYYTMKNEEIDEVNTDGGIVINGTRYYIDDNYYQSISSGENDLISINGKLYPVVHGQYDYELDEYKNNYVIVGGKLNSLLNGDIGSPIVLKQPINNNDINIPSLNSGSGNIILPNDAGGKITLNIAGKNYEFSVVKGVASVKVPDLANGEYSYIITYSGDNKYSSFSRTGSVTVNKQTTPTKPVAKTTITLKTVTVKKSAKKLVLQATLKQGNKVLSGKKITFKFNGKTYKATTNKKGIAKVTIKKNVLKKLKVGKKVTYQASYGKNAIAKKTAKVKK